MGASLTIRITILCLLIVYVFGEESYPIANWPEETIVESLNFKEVKENSTAYLSGLLCGSKSRKNKQHFKEYVDELNDEFEIKFVDEILHDAIRNASQCKDPIPILNFLYETYEGDTKESLIMMIRLQVQIFENFVNSQNFDIQPRCGFVLYKIRNNVNYQFLAAGWKQKVDVMVSQLPTSVQYVFFLSYFCLMNDYYNEYIYTTSHWDAYENGQYVFTWIEDKLWIDPMGYIIANIFDSVDEDSTDFSVQLKSTLYSEYYYTMLPTKRVAVWQLASEPHNSFWKIIFINDQLVRIQQGDNSLCAEANLFDGSRRYVSAIDCCTPIQALYWKLGKCNRT